MDETLDLWRKEIRNPDQEERAATALVLVIDRSGSMQGERIEICKSAAIATVEFLTRKDYVGVVAFDSEAHWVVPMTKVTSAPAIAAQVSGLTADGGTGSAAARLREDDAQGHRAGPAGD